MLRWVDRKDWNRANLQPWQSTAIKTSGNPDIIKYSGTPDENTVTRQINLNIAAVF